MTNLEKLRLFIQDAPALAPQELIGNAWPIGVSGDDFTICESCLGRILARGCAIPAPNRLLWSDRHSLPVCDLQEFHE